MAMTLTIDQKSLKRQIGKIAAEQKKKHEIAAYRTLNIVSRRGKAHVAREIKEDTGYKVTTIKRAIKTRNATKRRQVATWFISGRRMQYPGVREIKRRQKSAGVSYLARGKKRIKELDYIGTGSKLFVIKGQHSTKNIAVYRQKGHKRKVTTFQGHSVPYMIGNRWKTRYRAWVKKEIPKEYKKQLKKTKFA